MSRPFEPQLGPLPQSWPSLDEINTARWSAGIEVLPSDVALTEILLAYGFTACEATPYIRRLQDLLGATSEAEVLVA